MAVKRISEWRELPVTLTELCIDTTLRCGQSFRWRKLNDEWYVSLQEACCDDSGLTAAGYAHCMVAYWRSSKIQPICTIKSHGLNNLSRRHIPTTPATMTLRLFSETISTLISTSSHYMSTGQKSILTSRRKRLSLPVCGY